MVNKILVAYDFSDSSKHALEMAVSIGEKFAAHIYVLHVADPEPGFVGYEPGPGVVRDQIATKYHAEHKQLQLDANKIREEYQNVTAILAQGPIVETILSEAGKLGVDMIVVGADNKTRLKEVMLGSISKGLLSESGFPVLVCK